MYKKCVLPEEIEKLPLGCFKGKIVVVDKPGIEYLAAVAYLKRQKMIGFDTETRPVFSPGAHHNKVALLQLSGRDKAFLFRLNKMKLGRMLCSVLSDPDILKIGAASGDDVHGLQKRANFRGRGFVDLQQIAWRWGIRDKSVKKLAANILGVKISKTQQLSNWEAEELSVAQKKYAATDAWVCLEMYEKLMRSEEHPLSREELNPPQPQQKPAGECAADKDAPEKPKSRRRKRHRKPIGKDGENNTEERKG